MSRPARIPENLGAELVAAREAGHPWKVLMRRYGLGRTRLWQVWREELRRRAGDGADPDAGASKSDNDGAETQFAPHKQADRTVRAA